MLTCSGNDNGGSNPNPGTPSTTPAPTPTPTPAPGGGSGPTAPLYAQCGGQGYSGPTACASGTCKKTNDWYSMFCLRAVGVDDYVLTCDCRPMPPLNGEEVAEGTEGGREESGIALGSPSMERRWRWGI